MAELAFPKRLAGKKVAIFIDYQFEDLEVTFPMLRSVHKSNSRGVPFDSLICAQVKIAGRRRRGHCGRSAPRGPEVHREVRLSGEVPYQYRGLLVDDSGRSRITRRVCPRLHAAEQTHVGRNYHFDRTRQAVCCYLSWSLDVLLGAVSERPARVPREAVHGLCCYKRRPD